MFFSPLSLSPWLKFFIRVPCLVRNSGQTRLWGEHRDNGIIRGGDIKFSPGSVPLDLSILKKNPGLAVHVTYRYEAIYSVESARWILLESGEIRAALFYETVSCNFRARNHHRWTGRKFFKIRNNSDNLAPFHFDALPSPPSNREIYRQTRCERYCQ